MRVLERATHARELGFALLLAPNAMASLRSLGLADGVIAGGVIATHGFMKRPDGTILRTIDASKSRELLGEPTVMVLRPVLHGALLEAVGAECLSLGQPVRSVELGRDSSRVMLADGTFAEADVIVGADGVGSVVRRALHPREAPPRPSGLFAVRGVAPGVVPCLGGSTGAQYFGRGIEAGVAQASADAVYWYLSLPSGMVRGAPNPRQIIMKVTRDFEPGFRQIVEATPEDAMRVDELFERPPLAVWGQGNVTLLGDAAHPMLPHAGQGAAQALEDAVALGERLAAADDIPQALRHYESARARRTRTIVALARRNARVGSLSNPLACRLRDRLIAAIPERVILRSLVAIGRPPSAR